MNVSGLDHELLGRLLSSAVLRQKVIADNVANQNTPGYRRRYVEFESLLRETLAEGRGRAPGLAPRVLEDLASPARADGNNVSLELEISQSQQNRLLYEAYMNIGALRMELIRAAIEEGR